MCLNPHHLFPHTSFLSLVLLLSHLPTRTSPRTPKPGSFDTATKTPTPSAQKAASIPAPAPAAALHQSHPNPPAPAPTARA
ncbi:hypothetical protein AOQ84DRAFT_355846 [Glonium stellatum]|uniref:Uncharacterized protein n=1 Tax=Glonium stellatum TaxID=574774 RepID=A0A8E2EVM9_9PEZI|nr:hypothetical protein AOQ84DRAFT_355846 [Glonium stellatum]